MLQQFLPSNIIDIIVKIRLPEFRHQDTLVWRDSPDGTFFFGLNLLVAVSKMIILQIYFLLNGFGIFTFRQTLKFLFGKLPLMLYQQNRVFTDITTGLRLNVFFVIILKKMQIISSSNVPLFVNLLIFFLFIIKKSIFVSL